MIRLPWPPSSLSGHAKGHWRAHAAVVARHRAWAKAATLAAKLSTVPAIGDITVRVTFTPPDRRSDRFNFGNRIKPYVDGIADALKVNDRRFVPTFVYLPPKKPGGVLFEIEPTA